MRRKVKKGATGEQLQGEEARSRNSRTATTLHLRPCVSRTASCSDSHPKLSEMILPRRISAADADGGRDGNKHCCGSLTAER